MTKWQKELIENATSIFAFKSSSRKNNSKEIDELHAKIREVAMENDFLALSLSHISVHFLKIYGTHHLKGFSGNRSNRDPQFDSCRTG